MTGHFIIIKIISGGQTGADRAALDFAMTHNLAHGGWIPKGRLTEAGPLDRKYQLKEMPTAEYAKRTERNVLDSDGTVIVSHGRLTGGSALTQTLAHQHRKPCLHVDMDELPAEEAVSLILAWIVDRGVKILNLAGPAASKDPKIYGTTVELLEALFDRLSKIGQHD
jgi:hypothetical protein